MTVETRYFKNARNKNWVLTDRVIRPDGKVEDTFVLNGKRMIGNFVLIGQVKRNGLLKNIWVYDDTAVLQPTTVTHPAYYGTLSNSTTQWTNPSAAATEFSSGDYTAVQNDDGTRTLRSASAVTAGRYANIAERYTFDLSGYGVVSQIDVDWDGYFEWNDLGEQILNLLQNKTGAATWTNQNLIGEDADALLEFTDTTIYTESNIWQFGALVVAIRVLTNPAINLRTDYVAITVTYVPAPVEEKPIIKPPQIAPIVIAVPVIR